MQGAVTLMHAQVTTDLLCHVHGMHQTFIISSLTSYHPIDALVTTLWGIIIAI